MEGEWLRVVVEDGHDALAVIGHDGRPRYVNPATRRLLGDLEPGTSFGELVHPDDRDAVVRRWRALPLDGPGELARLRLRRADGAYRHVEASARGTTGPDGSAAVVVSLRSADARRSLYAMVEHDDRVLRTLQELLAPHRDFLGTVAHELRTPLTGVLAAAELLETRAHALEPSDLATLHNRIAHNARRLRDRVEQFLSMDAAQRLAAPDLVPVTLRAMVDAVVGELFAPEADVRVDVDPDVVVDAEEASLRDALRALLANVIVHAGHGAAVRVALEPHDDGAMLVVEDDGPGIPPGRREAVLEPFVTFDVPPYRPTVGLGLHLVQRVAEAHGGRVWVGETERGGARLCLLLGSRGAHDTLHT